MKNMKNMIKLLKKQGLNLIIISLILLTIFAHIYESQSSMLAINLNGTSLGLVKDNNDISKAIEIANNKIKEKYKLGFYNPDFIITNTFGSKSKALTEYELADKIITEDTILTNAWIVNISGQNVCALYDRDEALDTLSKFKQSFIGDSKRIIKDINFLGRVDINFDKIDINMIKTKHEFLDLLKSSIKSTQVSHYKKEGLVPYKDYNNVYIKRESSSFDVFSSDELEEKIKLPASTIFKYDENLNIGETELERQGEDGILFRKSINDYINDKIIRTTVLEEKLLSYPMSTIVRVGDRELTLRPSFTMPTYGVISSGFGPRFDGFHRGIDIAGPLGSDIKASAPGKVTFAGYMGTYGYVVFIEHANGYETRYAHLLKIKVSKGDSVNTGDILGEMGSSGNSTGAHLHFEILKDGQILDPENEL